MRLADANRVRYDSVTSTMDVARDLCTGSPDLIPLVVIAGEQRKARGRLGASWASPKGNLYATLAFEPGLPVAERPKLSFAIALALYDAVYAKSVEPPDLKLKWPNDVLLGGSKIAGLLVETTGKGGDRGVVLIGIGVNLLHAPPNTDLRHDRYRAGDLAALVHATPEALLAKILEKFDHWLALLQSGRFEEVRQTWLSRAYGIGQQATVRLSKDVFCGTFKGIDASGNLELELADGTGKTILAGSVFFD